MDGSIDGSSKDDRSKDNAECRARKDNVEGSSSKDSTCSPPTAVAATATTTNATMPPLASYIPPYLTPWVHFYHGDFCYARVFHPQLLAQLLAEGFLPICTAEGRILLPKLHAQRCVIDLQQQPPNCTAVPAAAPAVPAAAAVHVSKAVRKKSKRYRLTINQAWERVVEGCRLQHGNVCWLYDSLVGAFRALQSSPQAYVAKIPTATTDSSSSFTNHMELCPVRLLSVEVWSHDDVLVAGELGYTVGTMYTSLTGFSNVSGAGSVQLAATGRLLQSCGYRWWDLGMDMAYKRHLGAVLLDRPDFVQQVHACRTQRPTVALVDVPMQAHLPRNCRALIDQTTTSSSISISSTMDPLP
jgi:Leu/Phe-tRNA-protein transferase